MPTNRMTVVEKDAVRRPVIFTHHVEGVSAVEVDIFLHSQIQT